MPSTYTPIIRPLLTFIMENCRINIVSDKLFKVSTKYICKLCNYLFNIDVYKLQSLERRFRASKMSEHSLDYFMVEMFILKLFGINLTDRESKVYTFFSFLLLTLTIVLQTFLAVREMFINGVERYFDYMVYEFAYAMALAKISVIYLNRKKLGKVLNGLHKKPFLPNVKRGGKKEKELINDCRFVTRVQMCLYWGVAFGTVSSTILYTIAVRIFNNNRDKWILAYGPVSILNTSKSPGYELILFYQNLSIACTTMLFTSIDLLIASILAHISYQFRILQNYANRLVQEALGKNYDPKNMISLTPTISWKRLKTSYVKFMKYHLAIIDMARNMEESLSTLLLLVYLGTIGLLCFEIYRGSVMTSYVQLARTLGEILSFMVQIGFVSFWGEQVIFQSQEVSSAVYNADLVGTDLRFQKALLLTMIRSQRPIKLTAGKFALIQLFTFTWVIKTSYSAFMILRRAQH